MYLPKLILRNWWRNKLFVTISLVSLVVGITCTNLLTAFVLHEYNIESNNPNRDRIVRLTQELAFTQQKVQATFVYHETVPEIVAPFPEIEAVLRTQSIQSMTIHVGNQEYEELNLVTADSTFERFFPLQTVTGSVDEVLTHPGTVAVSGQIAERCFGTTDCLDKYLVAFGKTYRVAAVFHQLPQSVLKMDLLMQLEKGEGVECMLLLKQGTDIPAFRQRLAATELPTLLGKGHYNTLMLRESYFDTTVQDNNPCMKHRQITFLCVGLIAALLILFIGCFNYVNLSFSRLIKQIRMLRIENLMGATRQQIRRQLFTDTFGMVFVAFLLSILLMSDLLAKFNSVVNAQLNFSYLFSVQAFPVILLFVMLLSIVPATYISSKVNWLSESSYRQFYTGRRKKRIVSLLVTLQFFISIGLLSSFMIINSQMDLVKQKGNRYKDVIELSVVPNAQPALAVTASEVRNMAGVEAVTTSKQGLYPMAMMIPRNEKEQNDMVALELYDENLDFLNIYRLELLNPQETRSLLPRTPKAVVVNEAFLRFLVPAGENPIGQTVNKYLAEKSEDGTIIGVVKDFNRYSMTSQVTPLRMWLHETPQENDETLIIRFAPGKQQEVLPKLRELWQKRYPESVFKYTVPHQILIDNNKDITDISRILLMYAAISLFLTLFGLFGITYYAIRQRVREIGIRKVHGASLGQILWLVNRPFLVNIGIAFVVVTPVTYYLMEQWLQEFVYRVQPSATSFLLPLLFTACITWATVCFNSYRIARSNPVDSIKSE